MPTSPAQPPPDDSAPLRAASQGLPRGRHGLTRAFVITNQRERLLDAIAEAGVEKGYAAVTVKDVTARAGVSRRTFYDLFADKEECFLAAYDTVVDRTFATLDTAYALGGPSWPSRVESVLRALLDLYAAEPAFAHLTMVSVLAAGRAALERRDAVLRRFAKFLEPGRTGLPPGLAGHELITHAVVGGLYEALYTRVQGGNTSQLPELGADLLYCTLMPFLGHVPALAVSDAARATPGADAATPGIVAEASTGIAALPQPGLVSGWL